MLQLQDLPQVVRKVFPLVESKGEESIQEIAQNIDGDFLAGLRKRLTWVEASPYNLRKGLLKVSIAGRYLEEDLRIHLAPVDDCAQHQATHSEDKREQSAVIHYRLNRVMQEFLSLASQKDHQHK